MKTKPKILLPNPGVRVQRPTLRLLTTLAVGLGLTTLARAELPQHHVAAGNVTVIQNDTGNTIDSVTTLVSLSINDFRVRGGDTNQPEPWVSRGDYPVQIGDDAAANFTNGILMASVTENGRDNNEGGGFTYCVSMIESIRPATNVPDPTRIVGAYWIPVSSAANLGAGSSPEYNINVAGAWFPYSHYIGGFARNSGNSFGGSPTNGGALNELIGSSQISLGTNFKDLGGGKSYLTLTNLGIDSRTDGILLVSGAKNESANYGLSQVDTNYGGWNLFLKDDGQKNTNAFEQDPIAFVFIPKTNTSLISGRFRGDTTIDMYSGSSPQFTVTFYGTGQYELKIPGRPGAPSNGVLIISPEGGFPNNMNNMVSYQVNAAGDGWIIETRDTPVPGLEYIPAEEPVVSFVYLPGPTPGVTATPSGGLITTESGGQDTFTVALDTQPTADVTIAVSSSNTGEGTVSPASLTFTPANWNVPQTVTITGVDDAVADGSIAYTVVLGAAVSSDPNYSGLNPNDVSVLNADNEGGVTVAPTSGLVTTEAGGTATFTVRLNTQPSANVTINLSSSDTTEGTVSPASLVFDSSNWNVEQTVTVTGVDDVLDDGDIAYTVVTAAAVSSDPSYNGRNAPDVSVVNLDGDVSGVTPSVGLNLTPVLEGKTTTYTVVLDTQPSANVSLALASSDTAQGGTVAPTSLTFTPANWNTPQTVTARGADDLVVDGSTGWTITHTVTSADSAYAVLAPVVVSMQTRDNDHTLTLPSGDLVYGVGQEAVGIDGNAKIVDVYSPDYNGATLTVTITANGTADDRLEVRNTGTAAGQIGVSGSTVSYGGVDIATFSGGSGTSALVVTFNSASSPTSAQAMLRNITYRNLSTQIPQNRRAVSVVLARTEGYSTTTLTGIRMGLLRATTFQEGADYGYGIYSGEADIQLRQANPTTAYPNGDSAQGLFIDWPDATVANWSQILMRFDNIFGAAHGQVPTNAILVGAELMLRVPPEDSNGSGDGSPLYRMLIPWDATTATWNSMTSGATNDDVEARSAYDSQLHVEDGSGSTGTGDCTVSVTPDVQAWMSGQSNYGWLMPGWPGRRDGTTIRNGETAKVEERPRLRLLWLPANTASVASFRQGVNDYANAADTSIKASSPDEDRSALTTVTVDWEVTTGLQDNEQVLIKFDNIISSNAIPAGSTVHAAMIDLATVANIAVGHGGQFFAMLQPWEATNTWNSFVGGGLTNDGIKAAISPTAAAGNPTRTPLVQGGFHSYELTSDVQAWSAGTRPNYGWVILPWISGDNEWVISTSEDLVERNRPQLRVFYTAPGTAAAVTSMAIAVTGGNATITYSGGAGNAFVLVRSLNVEAPLASWTRIATNSTGSGTFTVPVGSDPKAFYRIKSE